MECALVDSGSGTVACPAHCAPEIPIEPLSDCLQTMVSATSKPIQVYGQKTVHYMLDNGEQISMSWNITNVNKGF